MALHGAIVYNASSQDIGELGDEDSLTMLYPSERYDSHGYHNNTNQDRLTAPESGFYYATCTARLAGDPSMFALALHGSMEQYSDQPKEYPSTSPFSGGYSDQIYGLSLEWLGWLDANEYINSIIAWYSNDYPSHPTSLPYVFNTYFTIRNISKSISKTICKVRRTSNLSIPHDSETNITWQSAEIANTDIWNASEPARLYFPETGYYHVSANINVDKSVGAWPKTIRIVAKVDGTPIRYESHRESRHHLFIEDYFTSGQYLQLAMYHYQSYQTNPITITAGNNMPNICVRRIDE